MTHSDTCFIGINDNRLFHVREVAHVCRELSHPLFGWGEAKSREMFALGFVHDIGYAFAPQQNMHEHIGGELLRPTGFSYAQEVFDHGDPDVEIMSDELLLLNIADMSVNAAGMRVTFEQRLSDIEDRYGESSSQYIRAASVVARIGRELDWRKVSPGTITPVHQ